MPLYCPRQSHHLQPLLHNTSLLEILTETWVDFMENGAPTMAVVELRSTTSKPNFHSINKPSSTDKRQGNWHQNRGHFGPSHQTNICYQLYQSFSHIALHYSQLQHHGHGQQPSINLTLSIVSLIGTVDWLLDTSANQHVTLDLANLTGSEPFLDNDNFSCW